MSLTLPSTGTKGSFVSAYVNSADNCDSDVIYKYLEYFGINSFETKFTYLMFSIIKKLVTSFVGSNIFHWLIVSSLIWIVSNVIYQKCMQRLLPKIGMAKQDQKHLTETIWQLCFTAMSIPVVASCLGASVGDAITLSSVWTDRLVYQLSKCKIHDEIAMTGVKSVYVLHSSFYAHDCLITWYNKGFKNMEFLQKQLFVAVFAMTYFSRCPLLGLTIVFLTHRAALLELLSRLHCLLSRFTHSTSLRYSSKALCACFVLCWMSTYLHIIPAFLHSGKTINSHELKAEIKTLIAIDMLIWIYIAVSLFLSVLSRLTLSAVMSGKDHPRSLEYFLFGFNLIENTQSTQKSSLASQLMEDESDESEEIKIKNKRAMIQTIRCYILLRRKLKKIRERKATELNEDENMLTAGFNITDESKENVSPS